MGLQWDGDARGFERRFGSGGKLLFAAAPGCVNLMGERAGLHEGFALPVAIDRHVRAVGRARDDSTVRIGSATLRGEARFDLSAPTSEAQGWVRRAEIAIRLALEGVSKPRGFDLWLDSDLPVGRGLGSSTAAMAAVSKVAAAANGLAPDPLDFARSLQLAEERFSGAACGPIDALAALLGRRGHALLADCRSLETRAVVLPAGWSLVLLDSGVHHDLFASELHRRRVECAQVLRLLRAADPGLRSLRDVRSERLEEVAGRADATCLRRCRHVVTEDERVHRVAAALAAADVRAVGELFAASHRSLRENYQSVAPEIEALVDAAARTPGCLAARPTGGGFGDCTVNLVDSGQTETFVAAASAHFRAATGREARAVVVTAADGVLAGSS